MMQGPLLAFSFYITVQQVLANSPPTFLLPSAGFGLSQDVSEDTTPGNSVYELLGQDADAEALTYAIKTQAPASPAFNLVGSVLTAPSGLDAETTQTFTFVFTVSDATASVDSERFTVNIIDVNEFDPVFSEAPYSGNVSEGAAVGTTVVTVSATDQDVTSTLTYSITAGNTPSTFAIDSAGAVTVSNSANVDPATTASYTLTVRASDGTRNADTTVTITVTAIQTDPVWIFPSMNDTEAINEDVSSGTSVCTLVANDTDMDPLAYFIESQSPATPLFTLSGPELQAPAGLDADSGVLSFQFVFRVSDGNIEVLSPTFTVIITDISDEIPLFSQDSYSANISEAASDGDFVVNVTATPDLNTATILYRVIDGNTPDTFEIDSSTGVITVKNAINVDPTTTPYYVLTVRADDGTTTATVTVTITVSGAVSTGSSAVFFSCITTLLAESALVLWLLRAIF